MTTVEQRARVAAAMSEEELLGNVAKLAGALQYRVHHCRPARTQSGGWRTPIQGDPGYPDLTLLRAGWVLFVECKAQRGKLTQQQEAWGGDLEMVAAVPGSRVRYFVWRPSDLLDGAVRAVLDDPDGPVT